MIPDGGSRRIAIVTNDFYPSRSVGVVRVTEWARRLASSRYEVTIIMPARADPVGEERVSWYDALEVLRLRDLDSTDGASAGRSRLWSMRASLARVTGRPGVPDRLVRSWDHGWPEVRSVLGARAIDTVLTSSPPHSIHLIGRRARAELGARWIADFRDPYIGDPRFGPVGVLGFVKRPEHERFEQAIHDEANAIIYASHAAFTNAQGRYPDHRGKVHLIPNGFPDELLPLVTKADAGDTTLGRPLRLVSAGRLGGGRWVIRNALARARSAGVDYQLRICGPIPWNRRAHVTDPPVENRITSLGNLPHREALEEIAAADVLLASLSRQRSRAGGCSSKLYEYMATGKPIVILNPTASDAQLLEEEYDDYQIVRGPRAGALAAALVEAARPRPWPTDRATVQRVRERHRRALGARALEAIIERG